MIRTGIGVDIHAFTEGEGIILGGVQIPFGHALAGHSDGDVVLHAVVDALLGSIAGGDIGSHFPSSDPQWKNADSRLFLRHARKLVLAAGGAVNNVDCTIILQGPPVAPYLVEMRRNIAADLDLDAGQVSVKATTTDRLGFTGRGEGVAAMAVATIATGT